jgi:hypothetical protein
MTTQANRWFRFAVSCSSPTISDNRKKGKRSKVIPEGFTDGTSCREELQNLEEE